MESIPFPQDPRQDERIIAALRYVGSLRVEYPFELLQSRRAVFIHQVKQQSSKRRLFSAEPFIPQFENLKVVRTDYPPELLADRRADFIDLVQQYRNADALEELPQDQEFLQLIGNLKSVGAEYPSNLMSVRRAAFQRQIGARSRISLLETLRTSVRTFFLEKVSMPTAGMLRTSLVVAGLMLAAFVGSLLFNGEQAFEPGSSHNGIPQPGTILVATSTDEVAKVICKPGYLPPLCLAKEFDKSQDLTYQGNGAARPAVAKDTLPGYSGVHKPAYVNDGLYGPGASWISNSAYSWIKIDLGKPTTINTIAFGRDRLGSFNDRDPGQFVIAVALSDNVYADGNSSNDYVEYTDVFNSEQSGFDGLVSGSETVKAQFVPVAARFIKITFANPGTAIDEVEAFMDQSSKLANYPTETPGIGLPGLPGISVTLAPTHVFVPTDTLTPNPTNTPVPTDTAQPVPTNTPVPTDTAQPAPTDTPLPPPTDPPPQPTDTSAPPTEPVNVEPIVVPTEIILPVE